MKKIVITTAFLALLAGPAMAQYVAAPRSSASVGNEDQGSVGNSAQLAQSAYTSPGCPVGDTRFECRNTPEYNRIMGNVRPPDTHGGINMGALNSPYGN